MELDDFDVDKCRKRWTLLRTKYGVEKRNEVTLLFGSGSKKVWPLLSVMFFLDKHRALRKTTGNIVLSSIPCSSTTTYSDDLSTPSTSSSEISLNSQEENLIIELDLDETVLKVIRDSGSQSPGFTDESTSLDVDSIRNHLKNHTPPLKKTTCNECGN
ncbi:hypothetical protein FQA39_LY17249 [Lamprigera yunnana]|nr:hypothetical protein FQA39_LY17249 [Lamprigera yunnana]